MAEGPSKSNSSDSETRPSLNKTDYWIYAENKDIGDIVHDLDPNFTGKWLIFEPLDKIDTGWAVIKNATEHGLLGFSAKVSTMKENPSTLLTLQIF